MTTDRSGPTRVLVVGGWGRCGSTLLDMLLGQVPGFVSAGEVRELWLRGCVEDRPCGCGEPFSRCGFWSQVGDEAFGGWDRLDLEKILRARFRWDRPWSFPRLLAAAGRPGRTGPEKGTPKSGAARGPEDLVSYVDTLGRLIEAIASVSGASVVVDSSKIPTHTLLLARTERLDVRVVHLVRDSRGVAFSNQKHVLKSVTTGEPTLLPRYGAAASALRYDFYNTANGALARRFGSGWRRLRYEDLVACPEARLREIVRHAGEPEPDEMAFLHDHRAVLATNHLVDGNPVRFARALTLSVDDEWRRRLSTRDRRTTSALTSPLLHSYAYPLRRS